MRPQVDLELGVHVVYRVHRVVAIWQPLGLGSFVNLAFEMQPLDEEGMRIVAVVDESRAWGDMAAERRENRFLGRLARLGRDEYGHLAVSRRRDTYLVSRYAPRHLPVFLRLSLRRIHGYESLIDPDAAGQLDPALPPFKGRENLAEPENAGLSVVLVVPCARRQGMELEQVEKEFYPL